MKGQIPLEKIMSLIGVLVLVLVWINFAPYIIGGVQSLGPNITALPMGSLFFLILCLLTVIYVALGIAKVLGESFGFRVSA
jgi:hypothetical protein